MDADVEISKLNVLHICEISSIPVIERLTELRVYVKTSARNDILVWFDCTPCGTKKFVQWLQAAKITVVLVDTQVGGDGTAVTVITC